MKFFTGLLCLVFSQTAISATDGLSEHLREGLIRASFTRDLAEFADRGIENAVKEVQRNSRTPGYLRKRLLEFYPDKLDQEFIEERFDKNGTFESLRITYRKREIRVEQGPEEWVIIPVSPFEGIYRVNGKDFVLESYGTLQSAFTDLEKRYRRHSVRRSAWLQIWYEWMVPSSNASLATIAINLGVLATVFNNIKSFATDVKNAAKDVKNAAADSCRPKFKAALDQMDEVLGQCQKDLKTVDANPGSYKDTATAEFEREIQKTYSNLDHQQLDQIASTSAYPIPSCQKLDDEKKGWFGASCESDGYTKVRGCGLLKDVGKCFREIRRKDIDNDTLDECAQLHLADSIPLTKMRVINPENEEFIRRLKEVVSSDKTPISQRAEKCRSVPAEAIRETAEKLVDQKDFPAGARRGPPRAIPGRLPPRDVRPNM